MKIKVKQYKAFDDIGYYIEINNTEIESNKHSFNFIKKFDRKLSKDEIKSILQNLVIINKDEEIFNFEYKNDEISEIG